MKKIYSLILAGLLCLLSVSCKKTFLELAPISNSNASNFYKTQADFNLTVNAAYATLYTFFAPQSGVSYFSEQMSDNATIYNISGIQADKKAFKDFSVNSSNSQVYLFWQQSYQALFNVNIVLDKIETANLPDANKDQVRAEMRFLRGMYYFYMVQMWGDLPLVTKAVSAEESYTILRSPKADVYNQVIADLQFAAGKLPLATAITVAGHASKGAAQSLLGKVYLAMGNKTAAAQALQEVVTSAQYSLLPQYASLWPVNNKNTKESIFEIQFIGGAAGVPLSNYYNEYTPYENFSITLYAGGMNQVTDDLYNEFENGDVRRDITISLGYTNKTGVFIPIKYPRKWTDANAPIINSREASGNNFMVIRYADVLLMLAEATGNSSYLNQVRARAGVALYGAAGYPSTIYSTLDLAIEHERRVELAIEFQRGYDLRRTGRAVSVLSAKGKAVTDQKLLLPIPEIVRQQNSAITQNPGY
ncbi:MAG: RagB/SusD family nutrient uptake outer membrane protein [Janthinobacterium lividum]